MKFVPSKQKYAKSFKGHLINNSPKVMTLDDVYNNGISLTSLDAGRLKPQHLEIINLRLKKDLNKNTILCLNAFPCTPVTSKPLEVRMGKGKGSVSFWAANVFSGNSVLKVYTTERDYSIVTKTLINLKKKLPLSTAIVYKRTK